MPCWRQLHLCSLAGCRSLQDVCEGLGVRRGACGGSLAPPTRSGSFPSVTVLGAVSSPLATHLVAPSRLASALDPFVCTRVCHLGSRSWSITGAPPALHDESVPVAGHQRRRRADRHFASFKWISPQARSRRWSASGRAQGAVRARGLRRRQSMHRGTGPLPPPGQQEGASRSPWSHRGSGHAAHTPGRNTRRRADAAGIRLLWTRPAAAPGAPLRSAPQALRRPPSRSCSLGCWLDS